MSLIKKIIKKIIEYLGIRKSFFYTKFIRMRRGHENISHLLKKDRADRFAQIYDDGVWLFEENAESLSGTGSEIAYTKNLCCELPKLLTELRIDCLLDVGCGDHPFKGRINNLVGIDPYNDCADYMVDILDYKVPAGSHDYIVHLV